MKNKRTIPNLSKHKTGWPIKYNWYTSSLINVAVPPYFNCEFIWQAVLYKKKLTTAKSQKKNYRNNNKNCATVWRALQKIEIIKITLRIVSEKNLKKKTNQKQRELWHVWLRNGTTYNNPAFSLTMSFGSPRTRQTTRKYDSPCIYHRSLLLLLSRKIVNRCHCHYFYSASHSPSYKNK